MNYFVPYYVMFAIHVKWRQGKIFSTLTFSICFMQMAYLLKKQKIHQLNLISVIYLFRIEDLAHLRKKTYYNIIVFTEKLLIDVRFPLKVFLLSFWM